MSNELAVLPKETALQVFQQPNGLDPILKTIRAEIDAFKPDMTTASGRAAIASFAYKVARSKTYLDDTGKELVAELKSIPTKIDAERKRVRELLDAWKDEVRRPLTEWEQKEETRVKKHSDNLASLTELGIMFSSEPDSLSLKDRIAAIEGVTVDDTWQEFKDKALQAKGDGLASLHTLLVTAEKREAEAAELQRLRDEAAARLRRENEERIAKEAADKARAEAEAKAAAERAEVERKAREEREAAERKQREAEQKARQEKEAAAAREAGLKRQAEKAEQDRKDAEERAVRAAAEERARIEKKQADDAEAARREAERREADKVHKTKINRAALAALVEGGVPEKAAKQAIQLIAKKAVPHVSIAY